MSTTLLLPGLYNSAPGHWQSIWEQTLPATIRVQQQNWELPQKDDWVASLAAAVAAVDGPVVLAAHSLGCALVAWWVRQGMPGAGQAGRIKGALLVAPPGVERAAFPAPSFAPMPTMRLPFTCKVIASSNDPWCDMAVTEAWARQWGAQLHNIGAKGHINGESGLGAWQQGQDWLKQVGADMQK
ncbi:alpha/beta hydrolase [Undibacterium sp.]|jgi:predicted alpha/beta hydrolase family esterase|uniref:RBBP9/YdeN family alpha/beta hydrolase n=1 Tax=Undibacterium sp. TaxID=1914977 RepID=UPI002BA0AB6B|nr:alpha/beta hydrolase [Undibacterium sp.]HTD03117.1 alpha/beta hydrolase [Undibacterium sp.]